MTDRRTSEEDNPFAPPPEGQPDQPWQPRHPQAPQAPQAPQGQQPSPDEDGGQRDEQPSSRWGSQWSRRQPRRQNGGFGDPPPAPEGRNGRGRDRNGGAGGGQRWDPTDPAQRHARYAVLAGMWGVFSGLLGWEWLGLLLGALSLYWGISALRGGPREAEGGRDAARRNRLVAQLEGRGPDQQPPSPSPSPSPAPSPPAPPPPGVRAPAVAGARPQFAAAVAGVVLAAASLLIVATSYTVQLVYKDYYDCVDDALTTPSREACEDLLPSQVRPFLTERG
jgi:hypothetical protein